jgi:hypothetical protein
MRSPNTTWLLLHFADNRGLEFSNQEADNLPNKTRQGYARKRTLKPAGSFFVASV